MQYQLCNKCCHCGKTGDREYLINCKLLHQPQVILHSTGKQECGPQPLLCRDCFVSYDGYCFECSMVVFANHALIEGVSEYGYQFPQQQGFGMFG